MSVAPIIHSRYVRVYDMEEPSDDVQTTLEQIARRLHAKMPGVPCHVHTGSLVCSVPCNMVMLHLLLY